MLKCIKNIFALKKICDLMIDDIQSSHFMLNTKALLSYYDIAIKMTRYAPTMLMDYEKKGYEKRIIFLNTYKYSSNDEMTEDILKLISMYITNTFNNRRTTINRQCVILERRKIPLEARIVNRYLNRRIVRNHL